MFKQVSAYKEDVTNYQVLRGGDDDVSGASSPMTGLSATTHNPVIPSGAQVLRSPPGMSGMSVNTGGGGGSGYISPNMGQSSVQL